MIHISILFSVLVPIANLSTMISLFYSHKHRHFGLLTKGRFRQVLHLCPSNSFRQSIELSDLTRHFPGYTCRHFQSRRKFLDDESIAIRAVPLELGPTKVEKKPIEPTFSPIWRDPPAILYSLDQELDQIVSNAVTKRILLMFFDLSLHRQNYEDEIGRAHF
jgi:hypothetical protein